VERGLLSLPFEPFLGLPSFSPSPVLDGDRRNHKFTIWNISVNSSFHDLDQSLNKMTRSSSPCHILNFQLHL
jgi:hypothetical protein